MRFEAGNDLRCAILLYESSLCRARDKTCISIEESRGRTSICEENRIEFGDKIGFGSKIGFGDRIGFTV